MTRGTDTNMVVVFTTPARPADPQPGTRPAPELHRYDRIRLERQGFLSTQPGPVPASPGPREPIAVLADVLARDGSELSAAETRRRNLANADHLAILGTIWAGETRDALHERYQQIVTTALPPGHRQELSPKATWLYRTMWAAELAGLDPAEATRTAIASRDLAGARDVAAVIDARIRQRVHSLLPQPQGPWSERVPHLADPGRQAYLAQIAAMMDDRTQRIGAFAASHALRWAITALGPVPDDPATRQEWENKASAIGGYREMYGYHHPTDPIGPEPGYHSPDQRAAWQDASRALGPTDGPDVRAIPDGKLWLIRDTYTTETAWAPRHVGRELRLTRLGATSADLAAIREDAETDAARKDGDHQRAGRHERWAASYRAMSGRYQAQEEAFAATMDDRREWEQATAPSRRLAIAADAELRRRHPGQRIEPLRSAEPVPVSDSERCELAPAADNKIGQLTQWVQDLAAQCKVFREKLEERHAQPIPNEHPGWEGFGQAFPSPWTAGKDTILQPPKPQITPSAKILHLTAEQDASPEAG
jgi:hypothetical protein